MSAPKGNRFGAKAKECEQALKRAMARKFDGDFRKGLDAIASNVVELAATGDKWATETIFDRIDGKPGQSIDVVSDTTIRRAEDLTDGDLADIAAGRSDGTAETQSGPPQPSGVH